MSESSKIETLGEDNASTGQNPKFFSNTRVVKEEKSIAVPNPVQNPLSNREIKVWTLDELTQDNVLGLVVLETLNKYEEKMRPKAPISRKEGGEQQTVLYNTLLRVLKLENRRQFKQNWELILQRFHENPNNVYDVKYSFRFADQIKGTKEDLDFFFRLLNLIKASCNPYERDTVTKRVSITKTLSNVSNDIIRRNLLEFYNQE